MIMNLSVSWFLGAIKKQEKTKKKLVDCDMREKPHSVVSAGWQPYGQLKLCVLADHACRVGWLAVQWEGEVRPPPKREKIKNKK